MLYFPALLNSLFRIMSFDDDKTVSRGVTAAIFSILKRYALTLQLPFRMEDLFPAHEKLLTIYNSVNAFSDQKTNHNPLLVAYVRYIFDNPERAPRLVFEELCEHLVYFLEQKVCATMRASLVCFVCLDAVHLRNEFPTQTTQPHPVTLLVGYSIYRQPTSLVPAHDYDQINDQLRPTATYEPLPQPQPSHHNTTSHHCHKQSQRVIISVQSTVRHRVMLFHLMRLSSPCRYTGAAGRPPAELFPLSFTVTLRKFLYILFCEAAQNLDTMVIFPIFMKDLLALMEPGLVFQIIHHILTGLNPSNDSLITVTMKFTFLKHISDYRDYVALNIPTEVAINDNSSDLVSSFWRKHFFAGLLLREIRTSLRQKRRIREQVRATTAQIFHTNHDLLS